MTKISRDPEPQILEEREVTLVESAERLINPELLKVSRHVSVRMGSNGATNEIDALLFEQDDLKFAVKVHEAGSKVFPQWSTKAGGIWTSSQAHGIARTNRRWTRTGEPSMERPPTGAPIDPHAQALRAPQIIEEDGNIIESDLDGTGYAMERGITLE